MATTFRDLFASRPASPSDVTHVRQFVSAGLALLTSVVVVTAPFKQSDWPLAQPPKSPPPDRVASESLPLGTFSGGPYALRDWPLANLPKSPPPDFTAAGLARQLQGPFPFAASDWPLAKTPPRPAPESVPFNAATPYTIVVNPKPFSASDWPLARLADSPIARDWVRANDLSRQLQVTLPFAQFDWALAKSADSPIARRWERANDLPRQLQVTLPFALSDWPLARTPLPSAPETPPLNTAVIRTIVAVQAPFASFDWPLAKRPLPPAPESPPLNIAVRNVGPAPFAFFDWSLAKAIPLRAPEPPPLSIAPQVGPAPFAQLDWALAKKPLPAAPETSALNIAAINTAVTVAAPFASFNWPLAQKLPLIAPESPPFNFVASHFKPDVTTLRALFASRPMGAPGDAIDARQFISSGLALVNPAPVLSNPPANLGGPFKSKLPRKRKFGPGFLEQVEEEQRQEVLPQPIVEKLADQPASLSQKPAERPRIEGTLTLDRLNARLDRVQTVIEGQIAQAKLDQAELERQAAIETKRQEDEDDDFILLNS